jgi:hypothetical protein
MGQIFYRVRGFGYIYTITKKPKPMYSLKCNYYTKEFATLRELLRDIMESGMDPNYQITRNGKCTGETAWDLIGPEA